MTTPTPENDDRREPSNGATPLGTSEPLDLGTQYSELVSPPGPGRKVRRLAPWLIAACALGLAGSAVVATGHNPWSTSAGGSSGSGLSLRLGTSLGGSGFSSAMADSATAPKSGSTSNSASYPVPAWYLTGDLVIDGTLPAGGQQVNLKSLLADKATLARVSALAGAFGLTGAPQRTNDFGGGFTVTSGGSQLIVLDLTGHPWAYSRDRQFCPLVPPGVLDGVACESSTSGGPTIAAPGSVVSASSGGGSAGVSSDGGSVATASSNGTNARPGVDASSASEQPQSIGDPSSQPKPDLPMVDVAAARAAAVDALRLVGMDPAKADVIAGPFASVSASPVIDGTPTQGVETWFSVTSTGIQSASGWLDISSSTVSDGPSVTLRSGADVINDMRGEPHPEMGIACRSGISTTSSSPAAGAEAATPMPKDTSTPLSDEPSLMPCPTPVPTVITGATSIWLLGYDKGSPVLVPGWSFTVRPTNAMMIGSLIRPAVDPKLFASPQATDQTNPGSSSPANVGPAVPPVPIPNSGSAGEPSGPKSITTEAPAGSAGDQPNAVLPTPMSSST